jgi:GT2 family glycosyltransferase
MSSPLAAVKNRETSLMGAEDIVRSAVRPVVVTGILVVHDGAAWLKECLDALSLQTRPLDRLVIIDTGSTDDSRAIVAKHARIRQVVGRVEAISAPRDSTFGEAAGRAVDQLGTATGIGNDAAGNGNGNGNGNGAAGIGTAAGAEWLWLLHDDSCASPAALASLLDAARRSPSVGVAGPKLVSWADPSRLLEVGSVLTRTGRRMGGPVPGEPDQGQYDDRNDVLSVSTSGMLIRRDVFTTLGGFDPAFGQFGDDLDLCWRAQLAGHRVVVAPRARMREVAASATGRRTPEVSAEASRRRERRHGRQVALARCSPYAAPFLALWIALTSLVSAAVLLLAKRPQAAWVAVGDIRSVLTPWGPMAARWRARGLRRVRRRDLRGLFASPRAGFGHALDEMFEAMAGRSARSVPEVYDRSDTRSMESGPASEEAESLERPARGAGLRVLRHPGFLAVMAAVLLAGTTWRSLAGALIPSGTGLAGGELLPVASDASQQWHEWLDGWHGAGLGTGLESSPYLPVLSAGAWVLEHVPLIGTSTSSVNIAIAWLLAAAVPASALTAYLGARAVTRAAWPRAWAALAWASLGTLTTAVAGGRVGAVVAHILLPLVAAGFVCAAKRSPPLWATFGAVAALVLTGAFSPALAVLGALAALVLLVAGRGRARLRAVALLLLPIGLLGPWILQVVEHPSLVLTGPGLTVWGGASPAPWQLELLHPGAPGAYPALLSAPIVLAGVLAMVRRNGDARTMTVLAVLTVTGLALGVVAPRLVLGLVPQTLPGAGRPVTAWAGTGLDLAALALIAAALLRFGSIPGRRLFSQLAWPNLLLSLVVTAAVLGVAATMVTVGWFGVGGELTSREPNIPAVAADQARGPLGNRLLILTGQLPTQLPRQVPGQPPTQLPKQGTTIGYRLVGAEPGPVVRDLPQGTVSADPILAAAVKSTVGTGDTSLGNEARDALANLGIGFVAVQGASTQPLVTQLDATAGMARLGNNRGLVLWRVLPRENAVAPSRLRLTDARGLPLAAIGVTGDHGQTEVRIGPAAPNLPPGGRRLVVAEPKIWAQHARVTFAGRGLSPAAGTAQPTYILPSGAGQLNIVPEPSQPRWRWGQLGVLLLVLFLGAPWGSTRSKATSWHA